MVMKESVIQTSGSSGNAPVFRCAVGSGHDDEHAIAIAQAG